METIISNMKDPSWWFTGLFFMFLVWSLERLRQPSFQILKRFFKGRRLKRIETLRAMRTSQASISYEIVRSHAHFMLFVLTCGLYLFWFTASPLSSLIKKAPLVGAILAAPIFIIEAIWLYRDNFTKSLIKEHNKMLKYARPKREPDTLSHAA